jgi:hypothetical protein
MCRPLPTTAYATYPGTVAPATRPPSRSHRGRPREPNHAAPAAAAPDAELTRLVDELGRLSPDDLRRVAGFVRSLRDESEP